MTSTSVYSLDQFLYINLTNRCTSRCQFCPVGKDESLEVDGYDLELAKEPSSEEILTAVDNFIENYFIPEEVVFCGYGEPTIRLKELIEISKALKEKGLKIRLNTNGHGNLIHKRNIVPDLKGLIDEVRISLNASNSQDYKRITKSKFDEDVYSFVKLFVLECKKVIPRVLVSCVEFKGLDVASIKEVAEKELGVPLMCREQDKQGLPQEII